MHVYHSCWLSMPAPKFTRVIPAVSDPTERPAIYANRRHRSDMGSRPNSLIVLTH